MNSKHLQLLFPCSFSYLGKIKSGEFIKLNNEILGLHQWYHSGNLLCDS